MLKKVKLHNTKFTIVYFAEVFSGFTDGDLSARLFWATVVLSHCIRTSRVKSSPTPSSVSRCMFRLFIESYPQQQLLLLIYTQAVMALGCNEFPKFPKCIVWQILTVLIKGIQ